MLDVQAAAFIRCDASATQADGLDSHKGASVPTFFFTMDCTGFDNGRQGSFSNNFVTTLESGKWIGLRGVGARNAGGWIAIVNDTTRMWCIDTLCYARRGLRDLRRSGAAERFSRQSAGGLRRT